jgi:hypothetical protein
LHAHLGSRQVSRVIYGAIIGLAPVVALQAHPPPPGAVIATLLGTAAAVALAEVYSWAYSASTALPELASPDRVCPGRCSRAAGWP